MLYNGRMVTPVRLMLLILTFMKKSKVIEGYRYENFYKTK